jgi:hypothetical protein
MFPPNNGNTFSDSDNMSAFASREYFAMMQQCASQEHLGAGFDLGGLPLSQYQGAHHPGTMFSVGPADSYPGGSLQVPLTQNIFDSPQETNRLTLTQEQFNALSQGGNDMQAPGHFNQIQDSQPTITEVTAQTFTQGQDWNHEEENVFPSAYGDALSSHDSSLPSNPSDQSNYPTSSSVGDSTTFSASPVDWTDSCSTSTSESQSQLAQQSLTDSSQWQPGQSKPIEHGLLQQQFHEAQAQQQALQSAHLSVDATLAWSGEDDFLRRDSQNSVVLTQQMSQFALQTPQPQLQGQFKAPQQPSSIAARRHVKRPAALSLRSTSYSGASGPASPSPGLKPGQQPLRRIQSHMAMNNVTNGRVAKCSTIGPAQRSPLNFTFAESISSPKALRHASTSSTAGSSLAPPTPLSPTEMTLAEYGRQPQSAGWSSVGHLSRHTSISETDAEHSSGFMHGSTTSSQPAFSSPPSTPMFTSHPYQQFIQGRLGPTILENTPPQSAPASQSCFSANAYSLPQQNSSMPPPPPPPFVATTQQIMQPLISPQNSHFITAGLSDEQYSLGMMSSFPGPQFALSDCGVPPELSLPQFQLLPDSTFAGAPTSLSNLGQIPSASVQQSQHLPQVAPANETNALQNQMYMSSQGQLNFTDSSNGSPYAEVNTHLHKISSASAPASELFVHEYSPPQDIKQATLPRKAADPGPKNYTFSNHGPEHFEKEKSKKGSVASSSPESFNGQ